jgi:hypothetical protein
MEIRFEMITFVAKGTREPKFPEKKSVLFICFYISIIGFNLRNSFYEKNIIIGECDANIYGFSSDEKFS